MKYNILGSVLILVAAILFVANRICAYIAELIVSRSGFWGTATTAEAGGVHLVVLSVIALGAGVFMLIKGFKKN